MSDRLRSGSKHKNSPAMTARPRGKVRYSVDRLLRRVEKGCTIPGGTHNRGDIPNLKKQEK